MPSGALLPSLLLLGYSVHLDTLTLVNWWTSPQEEMFTEGPPNIHICWSFPLGFTVSQKKNPLIFYLVSMRDFKLPAFREVGQERENLIFLNADITQVLSALSMVATATFSCAWFPMSSLRLTQSIRTMKLNKFHEALGKRASKLLYQSFWIKRKSKTFPLIFHNFPPL